jgi:DNA-binding MarR family transcriptional regulator
MTLPRFELLGTLCKSNDQTRSSLAHALQVTAASVTGLVDRAVRDGLVERRANAGDRRAWRVHLTAKGQRAFAQAERHHAARLKKLFAGLTPAELAALAHLLEKLQRALGARGVTGLSGPSHSRAGARTAGRAGLVPPRRPRLKRDG